MTIPRLQALNRHWQQFPPVHVSLALFLGLGKAPDKPEHPQEQDLSDLLVMLQPMG